MDMNDTDEMIVLIELLRAAAGLLRNPEWAAKAGDGLAHKLEELAADVETELHARQALDDLEGQD